jgi:hypothetical protein
MLALGFIISSSIYSSNKNSNSDDYSNETNKSYESGLSLKGIDYFNTQGKTIRDYKIFEFKYKMKHKYKSRHLLIDKIMHINRLYNYPITKSDKKYTNILDKLYLI